MLQKAKLGRGVSTLPAAAAFEIMLLAATAPKQCPFISTAAAAERSRRGAACTWHP